MSGDAPPDSGNAASEGAPGYPRFLYREHWAASPDAASIAQAALAIVAVLFQSFRAMPTDSGTWRPRATRRLPRGFASR